MFHQELKIWLESKQINVVHQDNYLEVNNSLKIRIIDISQESNFNYIQFSDVITIFSDEWLNKKEQCKAYILSSLGIYNQRIYARKCQVKQLSLTESNNFIEKYHIQGKNHLGVISFGLIYENELFGVVSLGRHNRQISENRIVLDRLCFKENVQVIGGATRLMKYCIEWATGCKYDEIISFSDNRWSQGNIYEILEFELEKEHKSDYSYIQKETHIRLSKQSQKKSVVKCPAGITEKEWAEARGLIRIYDMGKKRWAYHLTNKTTWKEQLSNKCAKQHTDGIFNHSHIRGQFPSVKNDKMVYYSSSYELRCIYLLEQDADIKSYDRCHVIESHLYKGKFRSPDLLVEYQDGKKEIIEVKPKGMLNLQEVQDQIEDSKYYAKVNDYLFSVWTEDNSLLNGEKEIIEWARKYVKDEMGDASYEELKKKQSNERAKRYYNKHIKDDKIKIFCDFCQEEHEILRMQYENNIEKNGRYICIKENGSLIGKKPKTHLIKENLYADQGKKQCKKCLEIKSYSEFSPDKSRRDGYASKCKECRAKLATEKYHKKNS